MQYTSYQNMKDVALWNLVLKGDMKALSFLYKKHYELLLNFGLKYTSDEEFVKDCIQDLFVKLCTSKRLSSTEYVRSYLLTSLKNVISVEFLYIRCNIFKVNIIQNSCCF